MALTKMVNGVEVQLTAQEEADTRATWAENDVKQATQTSRDNAFKSKKNADINALGSREQMQNEVASANSVSALRVLVLRLAEIIYSNEKGTID